MEFFKKKSLLTLAAAIAAMSLFVACGDTPPPPGPCDDCDDEPTNEILLDNFEKRNLAAEGEDEMLDYTNQNMIGLVSNSEAGSWYAYASSNGAKVAVYNESGVEEVITTAGPSDGAYSTTEASMYKTLGDDYMTAILDATTLTGAGDYYAAIETPFVLNGDDPIAVNLSKLTSIKILANVEANSALRIQIGSPKITNWAQWGWNNIDVKTNAGLADIETEYELKVADMVGPDWGTPNASREEALSEATTLSIELNTEVTDRAAFKIKSVILIFEDEAGVPAEFKFPAE